MPHSPAFRAASTKYIVIPPSFFAHASQAGQSGRSSKRPSVQPDQTSPIKMSFASQQAARLAQRRVAKQNEVMTTGTTAKVSSMISSTLSPTSSPEVNYASASSTRPSISSSSQRSQDISQTIKILRNLEDRLDDLLSKFQVIDHINIVSAHLDPQCLYQYSQNGPPKHVSFPVIALGDLLKTLEQELGSVEAHGNQEIEARRQGVVNRIKETTAYLEKTVHGIWPIAHPKRA